MSQDSVISSIRATLSHEFNPPLDQTSFPICLTLSDKLQSIDNQTLILPPEKLIAHLSFSHIAELLPIANPLKRLFYETEAIKCNRSVRELRRQIVTQLYERSGISLNPSKLIARLQNNTPQPADIIKHPFTFKFLGLKAKDTVEEIDFEQALTEFIQREIKTLKK